MLPLEKHSDYFEISSAFTVPMARTYHSELDLGENQGLHSPRCLPLKHRVWNGANFVVTGDTGLEVVVITTLLS